MVNLRLKTTPRIGELSKKLSVARVLVVCALLGAAYGGTALADGVEFSATVDRNQSSMDESVSLKLSVRTEGSASMSAPRFQAPDFDVVNEYTTTFVESYYENGKFGMRNNQQVTKILKPQKTGLLKITGIQVSVGGKVFTAPDISVQVAAGGAGTPPPKNYGGAGSPLRGQGKRSGPNVMVRAELSRDSVYKGEQVVVSYYLYQNVRTFNIQVEKYPVLNGFLREDLEIPVAGQHLTPESVVLDGFPYERYLLARYAAYPLQTGKMKIDHIALKYNYYGRGSNSGNEDDPFMNFFQNFSPRIGNSRSEPLTVQVFPLPEDGKPASFSGGVGDFSVAAAVDKYEVRANEAVTLTVKVEGRGNLAAIEEPKAKWPESLELYDSKGRAKTGRAGVGEKVFEFLLIPRAPGKLTLPALDFSFFDPTRKSYVTRSTEPIQINVLEAAPGSANVPVARRASPDKAAPATTDVMRYLKPPGAVASAAFNGLGFPSWRWLYWACVIAFGFFVSVVLLDYLKKTKATLDASKEYRSLSQAKSWDRLKKMAELAAGGAPWQDVLQAYELLTGSVFDSIDRVYEIGARSQPRSELERILVGEKGLSQDLWRKISQLLEFGELVRFASSAGGVSETTARKELERWVKEGETLAQSIERHKSK